MLASLAGSRTYLLAIGAAAVGLWIAVDDFGNYMQWFDLPNVSEGLLAVLGGGAAASLRAAVK
jgi:hypothetical protein